jgi:uncharacterized protein (TIGR02597 family)
MKLFLTISSALVAASLSFTLHAQSVTTDPVGYVTVDLLSGSDTFVSVPFSQNFEFVGSVGSVSNINGDLATISVSSSPNWSANEFSDFYFVRFRDGALEGQYFTVTSNTASELTIDFIGQDPNAIVNGDSFDIQPYWTLSTLFPPESTDLTASLGTLSFQRRSQVLYPDLTGSGINRSSSDVFFFTNDGWFASRSGFPSADDVIIFPDTFIVIRQPSLLDDSSLTLSGTVDSFPKSSFVHSNSSSGQDNFYSLNKPVTYTLAESNLSDNLVSSLGNLSFQRRDVILVFDNSARSTNKSASRVFFHVDGDWRESVSGFPSANDFEIDTSSGIVIRRSATTDGSTAVVTVRKKW